MARLTDVPDERAIQTPRHTPDRERTWRWRGTVIPGVDILAPEGLGPRTKLNTTPPGRTIAVPTGQQALHRREFVEVRHEGRRGLVPRPSILGAIIAKAAACALPGNSSRHERDLALLCALVPDPFGMREQLTRKDRIRLRRVLHLDDRDAAAWRLVPIDIRAQGPDACDILRG